MNALFEKRKTEILLCSSEYEEGYKRAMCQSQNSFIFSLQNYVIKVLADRMGTIDVNSEHR
jgi:hypothetical protein